MYLDSYVSKLKCLTNSSRFYYSLWRPLLHEFWKTVFFFESPEKISFSLRIIENQKPSTSADVGDKSDPSPFPVHRCCSIKKEGKEREKRRGRRRSSVYSIGSRRARTHTHALCIGGIAGCREFQILGECGLFLSLPPSSSSSFSACIIVKSPPRDNEMTQQKSLDGIRRDPGLCVSRAFVLFNRNGSLFTRLIIMPRCSRRSVCKQERLEDLLRAVGPSLRCFYDRVTERERPFMTRDICTPLRGRHCHYTLLSLAFFFYSSNTSPYFFPSEWEWIFTAPYARPTRLLSGINKVPGRARCGGCLGKKLDQNFTGN